MTPKLAIVGWHEGAAGQIHSWIEEVTGYQVACFINPSNSPVEIINPPVRPASQFDYPQPDSFKGIDLINSENWPQYLLDKSIEFVLITSVDAEQRLEQIQRAKSSGLTLISAIHPSATIMQDAILGENIILHARSFVGYRAEIGSGCVLNTGAQIDHHNVLEECVTVDPGVVTAGGVKMERFSTVHTNATIINNINIGQLSVVGAGAVVIRNVKHCSVVAGVPATEIGKSDGQLQDKEQNEEV